MDFYRSASSINVNTSSWDFSKCSRMVMLDTMTLEQIKWCFERNIIENLKPNTAKKLNMCALYAIIPSELIENFNNLKQKL